MALTGDQRALLRLLALREEGYGDIAALLGVSVDEVRARVRETLAELDGEAGDAGVAAAEPAEPPPPARPPEPPEAHPPAVATPAPDPGAGEAPSPEVEEPAPARPPRSRGVAPRGGGPAAMLSGRRLLEIGGGLLVLLLLVLFVTGALDVGGDSGDSAADRADEAAAGQNGKTTEAVLSAPGGGEASGRAIFGRIGSGPVLQVQAQGLEPTRQGQSYTVWLYRAPKLAFPIEAVKAPQGEIASQLPVPLALLSYVAGGAFDQIRVSRTDDRFQQRQLARSRKQRRLPAYTGATVLSGEIEGPLAGAGAAAGGGGGGER